ncbi:hypothetical protein [Chryseobacterium nepalense]|uniref:Uncharacterized protein n=1 Tax=Chryseobacterium nepalense TaxID=1854498 RepID=A0ABY4KA71_9FLAO|nr:hypothetical protein [Chryseobacterium nepalense]UPQ76285.1 hypothetical protein M0D58_01770 [Chryseobacterium nepalense]
MKKLFYSSIFVVVTSFSFVSAQKITDGESVDVNGLSVTFNILNKEAITVGGKEFDRYKVSAKLVNNTQKSYNVRLSNAPQLVPSNTLVEVNCINATGAKLTSKKIDLKLKPQNVNVTYWAYTKEGKYQSFVIPIIAGYYLDSGDSVNDDAIFIVPKGESPNVNVRSLQ